jgi:hypothetical protein
MAKMTWNEFRKHHKGKDKKEISELWSEYKGESLPIDEEFATINITDAKEISVEDVGEMFGGEMQEQIITQMANIDPNHGHDLDYIAEVEAEMALEDAEAEVKREEAEQEYLNTLNNPKKQAGLKLITHW